MKSQKQKIIVLGFGASSSLSKSIKALINTKFTVTSRFKYSRLGSVNRGIFPSPPPRQSESISGREHGWYNQFNQVKRNNNLKLT